MPVKLKPSSLKCLEGVHPHLVSVIKHAAEISDIQFQVICGTRTLVAQRRLVKVGASRTLKSRHLIAPNGLSHAVDLVVLIGNKLTWAPAVYHRLADIVKRAALEIGVTIEWGGDWRTFFDGGHFQLPWSQYPGTKAVSEEPPPPPLDREVAVLVPGSRGEAVMDLQRDLNAAFPSGIQLTVDGDFGPATRRAVRLAAATLTKKDTDIVTSVLRDKIAAAARKAAKHAG